MKTMVTDSKPIPEESENQKREGVGSVAVVVLDRKISWLIERFCLLKEKKHP